MKNQTFSKLSLSIAVLALLAVFGLAGCGGGGGGSSSSGSSTTTGGSTDTTSTATATLQAGTVAVGSTEVGTTVTVSSDSVGQTILTVQNAGTKLTNAQVGQVMVFEASSAMPLGFAGKVQSVQTSNVNGTSTTTATFIPVSITDVFQSLNLNLSDVVTNPQLIAGKALKNGARAYTKSTPQVAGGILGKIQRALIESNLIAQNTDTEVGVDFSGGIKASFWKVNGQWVGTDPGTSAPKVDIVFTGQVALQNPNFSQANIVIEDSKLVTHNLQLTGTLKRNIKASVTGSFEVNATDISKLFSSPTDSFYNEGSEYNEFSFDYNGATIKVHGVEKDPSKIILGAVVISAAGVVPTLGEDQTDNVLKTIPIGMVVTFFMTADMKVEATLSLGYQWRDMDIDAGMGFSYDDSLGLPVSLLTGQYQTPVPFWDATTHLDQTEGASYDVSGSANATLTAGVDGGIVVTGLEISQATVEGGIRGSLAGQLSMPVGGSVSGCYSSASVTAGVRALLDVGAGVELKTDFTSKWLKWLNTSVNTGYVYEFPMYPGEGVDYLAETTIWSAGDDTCHNPQFTATAGTALYSYSFDASATAYQPMVSSYTWDFGDGATASGITATHTYSNSGSYTAKLTVLYSDGIQKTVSKTVTVAEVSALNAAFTVNFNGLQASFDAGTSTPGADITGYSWSFGDGTTGTGITASHTYAAYSDTPWSVTLTVTDSYGRTASIYQNVSATCPSGQVLQNGQCVTPTPSAPTSVSTTAGNGQVSITWGSVSGATSYNIYWSTTSGVSKSSGTKLSNATSPYTHTGLTNGTTYYYAVTAVNSYGESSESSQVNATPTTTGGSFTTTPSVAAGGNFSMALKSDGTVWTWGENSNGQLGDGTTTERHSPVRVSVLTNVIAIGGGWSHSAALKNDGTVWAWGNDLYSQLGDGVSSYRTTWPVQVSGLTGVSAIAVGYYHTMALKSDGTVWTWGYGDSGQLGNGTSGSTSETDVPVQVSGLPNVSAIAAGNSHSAALKSDGTVWTWGENGGGQLGDGTTTDRHIPVQVTGLTGVKTIAAGSCETVALKNDGTVWIWGCSVSTTPLQVSSLSNISAVFAGYLNTIAVGSNGSVWIWGDNYYGQLADGTYTDRSSPEQLTGLSNITKADIGRGAGGGEGGHVIAQKSDGTVWTWGNNSYGQLGDGTTTNRTTPGQVSGL